MVTPYNLDKMNTYFRKAEQAIAKHLYSCFSQDHYLESLREPLPVSGKRAVRVFPMRERECLCELDAGRGFYVICSNLIVPGPESTYVTPSGLHAIYRGQSEVLRIRAESHLFHEHHMELKRDKTFKVSMKVANPETGVWEQIDIDQEPYCGYQWEVVQYPMPGCLEAVRNSTEAAFDKAFGRPPASAR